MGGPFTLSDDSHGIAQVGLNFSPTIDYLQDLGLQELHFLTVDRSKVREQSLLIASAPLSSIKDGSLKTSRRLSRIPVPDFRTIR